MSFVSLNDLEESEVLPGFLGTFVHSDDMTMVQWSVDAGSDFPEHSHPHEQISIVVEGEFELTVDGESEVLRPGRVAVVPSGTPHSGKARTDCKIIDVFHPVREDYRSEGVMVD